MTQHPNKFELVIVSSSHKWTGTGLGTSVTWSWLNRTRDSIYACIWLLFANWIMSHTCTYRSTAWRCSSDASSNVRYFYCGWYDVWFIWNKQITTRGPSAGKKMLRDWTEAMLDWSGPGPGRGPVLTLVMMGWYVWNEVKMKEIEFPTLRWQ